MRGFISMPKMGVMGIDVASQASGALLARCGAHAWRCAWLLDCYVDASAVVLKTHHRKTGAALVRDERHETGGHWILKQLAKDRDA